MAGLLGQMVSSAWNNVADFAGNVSNILTKNTFPNNYGSTSYYGGTSQNNIVNPGVYGGGSTGGPYYPTTQVQPNDYALTSSGVQSLSTGQSPTAAPTSSAKFYKPDPNSQQVYNAAGQKVSYDQYISQGGLANFSNVINGSAPTTTNTGVIGGSSGMSSPTFTLGNGQTYNGSGQAVQTSGGQNFNAGSVGNVTDSSDMGGDSSNLNAGLVSNNSLADSIFSSLAGYLGNINTAYDNLSSKSEVSAEEKTQQAKVANDQAAMTSLGYQAQGLYNPNNQAIDLPFLTGQAQNKMVGAGIQSQLDQTVLNYMQGNRQFAFNSASTLFDATRNNLSTVLDLYTKTAPQNVGTNYNPSTGGLTAIMRNPLTGAQYSANLGNIGAQHSFTSTQITTDPYTGALTFVGTTADGKVVTQPVGGTSGTTNPLQGGSSSGFNSSPTGLTTPAALNNNPGNLRDPKTGAWQHFSTPEEGFNALMTDIKGKQTGNTRTGLNGNSTLAQFTSVYAPSSDGNDPAGYAKTIATQLGVSTSTPIGQIPTASLAAAVAQHEDGKYWNAITNSQTTAAQNLPPALQQAVKNLPDGTKFFDGAQLTAGQIPMAQAWAKATGIKYVESTDASKLNDISVVQQNLSDFKTFADQNLFGGVVGKAFNWIKNTAGQVLGGTAKTQFEAYRTAAINTIQGLAGGQGSGLRLTQGEINTAIDNLPRIGDSQEQADTKLSALNSQLNKWINQIIPDWKPSSGGGNQNSTQILDALLQQQLAQK